MAQFSLTLINKHGSTVLTDYDTMAGKTAGLTFDEQLNLNVDGSTLDFSMLKYLYEGSQKVVNTPTVSITYGSIIKCLHNGRRYDFAVTDINYQFLPENLQLTFSAQDYFQFETSKQGIGYSITGDTTDPAYFGAQPIDAWAYKIIQDNNLRWGYVPINQANREWINTALSSVQKTDLFDTNINTPTYDYWDNHEEYSLNQWVSFECSESSAYNALKQLASENDLIIVVDYGAHNFWFAPKHNVIFNGYYFNPQNNLQQLGIKGSAQNLITVLDVTGPADINNQEITLVPLIPSDMFSWIMSDEWSESKYYPTLYADHTKDAQFQNEVAYTPWLENKLIDYSFFESNNLILPSEARTIQDILYNKLRIANGRMLVQQQQYLKCYGDQFAKHTQDIINIEASTAGLMGDIDTISNLVFSEKPACFAVIGDDPKDPDNPNKKGCPWLYWPKDYTLRTVQYGPITKQQLQEGGDYYGILSSPEVDPHLEPIQKSCTRPDLTTELKTPFQFNGEAVNWWSPSTNTKIQYRNFSPLETFRAANNRPFTSATIKLYAWCTTDIICFPPTTEYASLAKTARVFYQGSTWYAQGQDLNNGPAWSNPVDLSKESTVPNFGTITISAPISSAYCTITIKTFAQTIKLSIHETKSLSMSWTCDGVPYESSLSIEAEDDNSAGVMKLNTLTANAQLYADGSLITTRSDIPYSSQNTTIEVKATVQQPDDTPIQHIQMIGKQVALDFYATANGLPDTNHCSIKPDSIDGIFAGPLCLYQLNNAIKLTTSISDNKEHSAILIDILNQLCGSRDGYWQALAKNAYEFLAFWYLEHGGKETGSYVLKMQDVSFVDGEDIIQVDSDRPENSSHYYKDSTKRFDTDDIDFLQKALAKTSDENLTRVDVITYLQSSISYLTEKWNNCYAAATGLGIYWPKDWNNSKWLVTHYNTAMYKNQTTLITQLSPLIFNGGIDVLNLVPNLSFFPTSEENYVQLQPRISQYVSWGFIDKNKYHYYPPLAISDNTEIRSIETERSTDISNIYEKAWSQHTSADNLRLESVTHSSKTYKSTLTTNNAKIPAEILFSPISDNSPYSIQKELANPNLYIICELAKHPLYDTQVYYETLSEHDKCWQMLYQDYPGIFRESTYTNSTATSSHELYVAAKAQLDNLSRPSFEYSLTGMDIYMHDSDYTPTRLTLGEQIRIDYQDPDQLTDTLNAALREPLYVTGISHALRNDGDYQFTVTTRTATDSMVQRFAQLLSFGR